jgi:SAM-dependent methyltransferase
MPGELKHPVFARFFDRLSRMMEPELGPMRDELLEGLEGRALELGAGNGMNFAHYPSTVREVVAVEPEPYFRAKATEAAAAARVPVRVQAGLAGELDFQDASFDAVVCSLVLCSVPDQGVALADLHRCLRPGGELRFLEHVRGAGSGKQRVQRVLDRSGLWPLMAGGCHCNRDTVSAVRGAGFDIEQVRAVDVGPSWAATNPHVIGVARA